MRCCSAKVKSSIIYYTTIEYYRVATIASRSILDVKHFIFSSSKYRNIFGGHKKQGSNIMSTTNINSRAQQQQQHSINNMNEEPACCWLFVCSCFLLLYTQYTIHNTHIPQFYGAQPTGAYIIIYIYACVLGTSYDLIAGAFLSTTSI